LSEVTESLFSGHCSHQSPELEALGEKIEQLAKKIDVLLTREGAIVVPVQTFTPEPFDVLKEIPVVVRPQEDGSYVASFFDAAICMSGDNPEEAVQNLKEFMLGLYEDYLAEGEEVLGQEPLRQWKVLKEFIRRRE
jgi:predicted RNase H-like HicB family nuclease